MNPKPKSEEVFFRIPAILPTDEKIEHAPGDLMGDYIEEQKSLRRAVYPDETWQENAGPAILGPATLEDPETRKYLETLVRDTLKSVLKGIVMTPETIDTIQRAIADLLESLKHKGIIGQMGTASGAPMPIIKPDPDCNTAFLIDWTETVQWYVEHDPLSVMLERILRGSDVTISGDLPRL